MHLSKNPYLAETTSKSKIKKRGFKFKTSLSKISAGNELFSQAVARQVFLPK